MSYDESKYKVINWKNLLMLHWIINPGLAFNELVLGQRIPKISLLEKDEQKSYIERSFIPCPHCHTLHQASKWSTQNNLAFRNWYGLYCDQCGQIIPCLRNGLAAVILFVTYPLRMMFSKKLQQQWLQKQPARYKGILVTANSSPYAGKGWIKQGLTWGALMFVIMDLIVPTFFSDSPLKGKQLITGIVIWTIAGLIFGYVMKRITMAKNSQ